MVFRISFTGQDLEPRIRIRIQKPGPETGSSSMKIGKYPDAKLNREDLYLPRTELNCDLGSKLSLLKIGLKIWNRI